MPLREVKRYTPVIILTQCLWQLYGCLVWLYCKRNKQFKYLIPFTPQFLQAPTPYEVGVVQNEWNKTGGMRNVISGENMCSWRRKNILAINMFARSLFAKCVCVILLGVQLDMLRDWYVCMWVHQILPSSNVGWHSFPWSQKSPNNKQLHIDLAQLQL